MLSQYGWQVCLEIRKRNGAASEGGVQSPKRLDECTSLGLAAAKPDCASIEHPAELSEQHIGLG